MTPIPPEIRDEVIRRVYADCDRLEWETLSSGKKTTAYNRWVDDPEIGGLLRRYMSQMTHADTRVWLKDGPLHDYDRAINGVGANARYTRRRVADPPFLIRNALGADWELLEGSIQDRPLRCVAVNPRTRERTQLIWGPFKNLSSLAWAAVTVRVADRAARPVIVLVRPAGQILPAEQEREVRAVCEVIGAIRSFVVRPARRDNAEADLSTDDPHAEGGAPTVDT